MDDQTHGQAHEAVYLPHPLRVALGQVIIDRDNVDSLARQSVEVGGQGGHQGLAFTGLHLGDTALVQDDAAHHLHPVGAHAQHAPGGLPAGGKGLGQDVIQGLAVCQALLELRGLGLQLGVGQGFILLFQRVHLIRNGIDGLQLPLGGGSEQFRQQTHIRKTPLDCGSGFSFGQTSTYKSSYRVYHTRAPEKRPNCKLCRVK